MLLAELNVRHTRRHMPTRRVAVGGCYLPSGGAGHGAVLAAAVVAEHLGELDEAQRELLPRLLADARRGLTVPRIALRYRLQTDTHGLDRSRHRIVREHDRLVVELDRHGRGAPQVIGAVMAAATLPSGAREPILWAVTEAVARPVLPDGLVVRRLIHGVPGFVPFAPGAPARNGDDPWRGVPADQRWAMEVLGLGAGMRLDPADVLARFRRLVRLAHPDHGATRLGAAERLAELAEARGILMTLADTTAVARPGSDAGSRAG